MVAAELAKQHSDQELGHCREKLARMEQETQEKSKVLLKLESNAIESEKALLSLRKDKEMAEKELEICLKNHQERLESHQKQSSMLLLEKEKEIENRNGCIEELKQKHKEYIAASTNIKAEKEQLSRSLADKKARIDLLESEAQNIREQVGTYQQELAGIRSEHKLAMRDASEDHQTEVRSLKKRLEEEQANASFLRKQAEALQQEATLATETSSHLTKHNEKLLVINLKMADIISKYDLAST